MQQNILGALKFKWKTQLFSKPLAGKELISSTMSLELLTMAFMCADLRNTIVQTRLEGLLRESERVQRLLCGFRPPRRLWGSVAVNAAPADRPAALICCLSKWPSVVFISHTISSACLRLAPPDSRTSASLSLKVLKGDRQFCVTSPRLQLHEQNKVAWFLCDTLRFLSQLWDAEY